MTTRPKKTQPSDVTHGSHFAAPRQFDSVKAPC